MSQWKDKICGSQIEVEDEEFEGKKLSLSGPSEVLSCGGRFLPNPEDRISRPRRHMPMTLHLPKDHYEVIIMDEDETWVQYGGDYQGEDAEGLEDGLYSFSND